MGRFWYSGTTLAECPAWRPISDWRTCRWQRNSNQGLPCEVEYLNHWSTAAANLIRLSGNKNIYLALWPSINQSINGGDGCRHQCASISVSYFLHFTCIQINLITTSILRSVSLNSLLKVIQGQEFQQSLNMKRVKTELCALSLQREWLSPHRLSVYNTVSINDTQSASRGFSATAELLYWGGGGYDGLTWAVEVGRLDPVSRSTRAEVAVGSVDTDLPAAMVVSQTLVHCDNCKYAHVLALFWEERDRGNSVLDVKKSPCMGTAFPLLRCRKELCCKEKKIFLSECLSLCLSVLVHRILCNDMYFQSPDWKYISFSVRWLNLRNFVKCYWLWLHGPRTDGYL